MCRRRYGQPCVPRLQSWNWHNSSTLSLQPAINYRSSLAPPIDGRVHCVRLRSLTRWLCIDLPCYKSWWQHCYRVWCMQCVHCTQCRQCMHCMQAYTAVAACAAYTACPACTRSHKKSYMLDLLTLTLIKASLIKKTNPQAYLSLIYFGTLTSQTSRALFVRSSSMAFLDLS